MENSGVKSDENSVLSSHRKTQDVHPKYYGVFESIPCFNKVQSEVFDDVYHTDKSIVLSAPTGSGKTVIFELAIIRAFSLNSHSKMIYISPTKALCQERLVDWHPKFTPFGLKCISITGDSHNSDLRGLNQHNLVITTPEKWDSLTRKWRDHKEFMDLVSLFMIDEVHLLNDDVRGPVLEVIVSRMKTAMQSKIRFVALSATIPNIDDVAEWIGGSNKNETAQYKFSEDYRPVPLTRIVFGYPYDPATSNPFKFELRLNWKLKDLMIQYSNGKPTLIFCSTRKSVELTASHILNNVTINLNVEQKQFLIKSSKTITDVKLKEAILNGVAYHHAGLVPETRHLIESLFREGELPILVTTSTLSMGVNLPAHLVVVKSTKYYTGPGQGYEDYSETAILQMIGRAGRPQFDQSATALILTTSHDKEKYERMMDGSSSMESNLHRHLAEHLNSEVVLRTITGLDVALQWLSSTFLYVRARKNPRYYDINVNLSATQIDKKLIDICQIELNRLVKWGMLTIDENIVIQPTDFGVLMSKYCMALDSMILFNKLTGKEILQQILSLISKCHEFSELRLRSSEKRCLNLLNINRAKKTSIRFPLNGKIKTVDMKVNCIIQAVLGNLEISDQSILADSYRIMRNGVRICKCLIEFLENNPNAFQALLSAIIMRKGFNAQLWENSPYLSKQLTGIGTVMSAQLVNAGKTTFEHFLNANARDIEIILKKKAPFGNRLIDEVRSLPRYEMLLSIENDGRILEVVINLKNAQLLTDKCQVKNGSSMWLLVGDNLNNLLFHEKFTHSYMVEKRSIFNLVDLKNDAEFKEVEAHFISEDWVGFDCIGRLQVGAILSTVENVETIKTVASPPSKKTKQTFINKYMNAFERIVDSNNIIKNKEQVLVDQKPTMPTSDDKKNVPTKKMVEITKKLTEKYKNYKSSHQLQKLNKLRVPVKVIKSQDILELQVTVKPNTNNATILEQFGKGNRKRSPLSQTMPDFATNPSSNVSSSSTSLESENLSDFKRPKLNLDSSRKQLKWRSPLVVSPKSAFSPKMQTSFDFSDTEIKNKEPERPAKSVSKFPLSDKDYYHTQNDEETDKNYESLKEFCSDELWSQIFKDKKGFSLTVTSSSQYYKMLATEDKVRDRHGTPKNQIDNENESLGSLESTKNMLKDEPVGFKSQGSTSRAPIQYKSEPEFSPERNLDEAQVPGLNVPVQEPSMFGRSPAVSTPDPRFKGEGEQSKIEPTRIDFEKPPQQFVPPRHYMEEANYANPNLDMRSNCAWNYPGASQPSYYRPPFFQPPPRPFYTQGGMEYYTPNFYNQDYNGYGYYPGCEEMRMRPAQPYRYVTPGMIPLYQPPPPPVRGPVNQPPMMENEENFAMSKFLHSFEDSQP